MGTLFHTIVVLICVLMSWASQAHAQTQEPILTDAEFERANYDGTSKLQLKSLNVTGVGGDTTCADGTAAGYYYDEPIIDRNQSYIIWLGDSPLCGSAKDCDALCDGTSREKGDSDDGICDGIEGIAGSNSQNTEDISDEDLGRCYLSRAVCTSSWFTDFPNMAPLSVLNERTPIFRDMKRVFVPSCSLDWWMGDGDTSDPTSTRYRGQRILKELFVELAQERGLQYAPTVVFGGTRGAGVAVLNLMDRFKVWLDELPDSNSTQKVVAVIDSAWFPSIEDFGSRTGDASTDVFPVEEKLRAATRPFIGSLTVNQGCYDKWSGGDDAAARLDTSQLHRCWLASELVEYIGKYPVFFIQSRYDVVHMLEYSILSDDLTKLFVDPNSYAASAINFVETYGDSVRSSIERGAALSSTADQHTFFLTSCGHHGYILPTRLHTVSSREQSIGKAGSLKFRRAESIWRSTTIDDMDLQYILSSWVKAQVPNILDREQPAPFIVGAPQIFDVLSNSSLARSLILDDKCTNFVCNSACPSDVLPWRIESWVTDCLELTIYAKAIFLVCIFLFGILYVLLNVFSFRQSTRSFWNQYKQELLTTNTQMTRSRKKAQMQQHQRQQAQEQHAYGSNYNVNSDSSLISNGTMGQSPQQQVPGTPTSDTQLARVQEELLEEAANSEYRKIHLMLRGVTYTAGKAKKSLSTTILHNIDLCCSPGEVHALMGPSGCGKSTLVDVLALTRDRSNITGQHYINGVKTWSSKGAFLKEWLRQNLSYVRQRDVLFPLLTVREHLTHAAWLMLPQFMPEESKLRRVLHVIKLLELESCADTICGDGGVSMEGGISGGQRRRVSVATQLLRMPAALLLDEPTSGLDATNALLLVKSLHLLAHRSGVNVVMAIHQPRKEIYAYLDHLSILVAGRLLFSGPPKLATNHFNIPPGGMSNIGNEILDIISKSSKSELESFEHAYLNGPLGEAMRSEMEAETTDLDSATAKTLRNVLAENALAEGRWSWTESSSSQQLMWVLVSRTHSRGGFDVLWTCLLSALGGLLVGVIFLDADTSTGRTALVYLLVATLTFMQGVFLGDRYQAEKKMFDHERDAGTFSTWTAFIASQFLRNAMTSMMEGVSFGIPVYFIGGMNQGLDRLLTFFLLMALISMACIAQNVLIEIYARDQRHASLMQVGVLGLGALFNGFIVRLSDLPVYFSWLPYVLLNYWGFVGTLVNDFAGVDFQCDSVSDLECSTQTGDNVVRSFAFDNRDVPQCLIALTGITIVLHILGFVVFYVRHVRRRRRGNRSSVDGNSEDVYSGAAAASAPNTPKLSPSSPGFGRKKTGSDTSASAMGRTMDGMMSAVTPNLGLNASSATTQSPNNNSKTLGSAYSNNTHTPKIGGRSALVVMEDNTLNNGGQGGGYDARSNATGVNNSSPAIRQHTLFGAYLIDRISLTILFFVDFFSTSYVCAVQAGPLAQVLVIGVSAAFAMVYLTQFLFQVVYLVPQTPNGVTDCTWAGGYDIIGLICTFVDVGLSLQLVTAVGDSFVVIFVLQMVIRFVRFLRLYCFWGKVTAFHRLRAKAFRSYRDEMRDNAEEDAREVEEVYSGNNNNSNYNNYNNSNYNSNNNSSYNNYNQSSHGGIRQGGQQQQQQQQQQMGYQGGQGGMSGSGRNNNNRNNNHSNNRNNNNQSKSPKRGGRGGAAGANGAAAPPRPPRPTNMPQGMVQNLRMGKRPAAVSMRPARELGPQWQSYQRTNVGREAYPGQREELLKKLHQKQSEFAQSKKPSRPTKKPKEGGSLRNMFSPGSRQRNKANNESADDIQRML